MGLDNGITIRARTEKGKDYLEKYFINNSRYSIDEYEFGYWRKCWNIRQKFIDDFGYDEEKQLIIFELDDIPAILNTLKYFLNEDNWEYNGNHSVIFNWYEEVASIANAINDLYTFYANIDVGENNENDVTDEDFEIFFYDSY